MLCEAPIRNVHKMELHDKDWYNSIIQTDYGFEFHATDGQWLILETAAGAIRLGYDGICFFPSYWDALDAESTEHSFANEFPFEGELFTLLYGQRLQKVLFHGGKGGFVGAYHELVFDHCSLKLYVYTESDWKWFEHHRNSASRPMGVGSHLLKRKCSCGGEPKLWIDHNGDYLVRCESCHQATEAEMGLRFVIDEWNESKAPCRFVTDEEIFLDLAQKEPIEFLAVNDVLRNLDENLCEAEEILVGLRGCIFHIRSNRVKEDYYVPAIDYHCLTPQENLRQIQGNITFCCMEEDRDGKRLRFLLDDAQLIVTPKEAGLIIRITT